MPIKLKPLADRLVVAPKEREEQTPSGLILPGTAKETSQEGKIIAVGPGRRDDNGQRIALDVAVGNTVLFAKYAGSELKIDGKKLLILNESDILAIVES